MKVLSSQNTKRISLGFAANNLDTELYISTKDQNSIKHPFSEKNVKPYICCPTSENRYIAFGFKCLTNSDFLVLTKKCDEKVTLQRVTGRTLKTLPVAESGSTYEVYVAGVNSAGVGESSTRIVFRWVSI